jgi:hypothetical protein
MKKIPKNNADGENADLCNLIFWGQTQPREKYARRVAPQPPMRRFFDARGDRNGEIGWFCRKILVKTARTNGLRAKTHDRTRRTEPGRSMGTVSARRHCTGTSLSRVFPSPQSPRSGITGGLRGKTRNITRQAETERPTGTASARR